MGAPRGKWPSESRPAEDSSPAEVVELRQPIGFDPDEELADAALTEIEQLASRFREIIAEHQVDARAAETSRTNIDTAVLWARVAIIG